MHTQVFVDAHLLAQAMQKMRIQDSQLLVEKALRFMLEPSANTQKSDKPIKTLIGIHEGQIAIHGDIIEPLDV